MCSIIINFLGSFCLLGGTVSMAKKFHGHSSREQEKFASNIFFLSFIISFILSLIIFILFTYGSQTHTSEILTIKNKPYSYGLFLSLQSLFGAIINIYLIKNYDLGVDTLFYSMLG